MLWTFILPTMPAGAAPTGCFESVADAYVTAGLDYTDIAPYAGDPYIEVDGGVPGFSVADVVASDGTVRAFELYSPLDDLGRVGVAEACLGPENAPTSKRGSINEVIPTGWHDDEYVFVEGEMLFNRCHLIARSLSAENANPLNLATGTSYMNRKGMLPFEVAATDYIAQTGNHVLYRASPVFVGDELVCRGVQLEALSVEDGGAGISFNVFCYNVQPGVTIDYATGDNAYTPLLPAADEEPQPYVINAKSRKAHLPDCPGTKGIKDENRIELESTPSALAALGYEPCGQCQPWKD